MLLSQCVLTILLFLAPYLVGFPHKKGTAAEVYLYGQVLLWAVFQLLAVPMIFLCLPFNALFCTSTSVLAFLTAWGVRSMFRTGERLKQFEPEKPYSQYLPYILAGCVILFQMGMYAFGLHLDEDDSRFLVEANDAVSKNTMYLHNPATGEYLGRFMGEMKKDRFSPWAMYIAFLSRFTRLRPAVMAHTVYPPVLLLLSYVVYDRIGQHLFSRRFERGAFLLSVSVINMFFVGNAYSQSSFSLIRIWQGKAGVAAIMIPLFLLLMLELEEDPCPANWRWLGVAGCATCLFSGMGVAFSAILIAGYGGYVVLRRRFRHLPRLLLALVPSMVFGLLYFWWR